MSYQLVAVQLAIIRYSPLISSPWAAYIVPYPKAVSELLVWKRCSENRGGQTISFGASVLIQLSHKRSCRQLSCFHNTYLHLASIRLPCHFVGFVCSCFPRLWWWRWQGLGRQLAYSLVHIDQHVSTQNQNQTCKLLQPPHSLCIFLQWFHMPRTGSSACVNQYGSTGTSRAALVYTSCGSAGLWQQYWSAADIVHQTGWFKRLLHHWALFPIDPKPSICGS